MEEKYQTKDMKGGYSVMPLLTVVDKNTLDFLDGKSIPYKACISLPCRGCQQCINCRRYRLEEDLILTEQGIKQLFLESIERLNLN